jgi:hypothetical protein
MGSSIPVEVLSLVLDHVLDRSGDTDFVPVTDMMVVCREWYHIIHPKIWRHVVLDSATRIQRFADASNSDSLSMIRSLTVSFDADDYGDLCCVVGDCLYVGTERYEDLLRSGCGATRIIWTALYALSFKVPDMKSLATSSLTHAFWIRVQDISRIVTSLPDSVENLEIDLKGQDRTTSSEPQDHICHAISAKLPRLRHLRLRLSTYCDKVLSASQSLETCVISTIKPGNFHELRECSDQRRGELLTFTALNETHQRTQRKLITRCLELFPSLPRLQKFVIIEFQDNETRSLPLINVRDIKANTTTSMPILNLSNEIHDAKWLLRALNSENRYEDVVGQILDVEEAIEGDHWAQTGTGSRFPSSYRNSIEGKGHKWVIARPYKMRDEYLGGRKGEMPEPWEDEAVEGCLLMEPRVVDGVGEVEPMFMIEAKRELERNAEDDEFEHDDSEDDWADLL